MQRLTQLLTELEETERPVEQVEALSRYFAEAPPRDAAWGLYFLTGGRPARAVPPARLRQWVAEAVALPLWLVEDCHQMAGDLAETLTLLLPDPPPPGEAATTATLPLHVLVEERLLPFKKLSDEEQRRLLTRTWGELDYPARLFWHRLILGEFRPPVARGLVAQALAGRAGISPAEMAHRLSRPWRPTEEDYRALLGGEGQGGGPGRPYPFCLACELERAPAGLGPVTNWLVEWHWEGIRAQLIRRAGHVMVWSRTEELLTDRFPELEALGRALPKGTVLDGQIVAWGTLGTGAEEGPLPGGRLESRLAGKRLSAKALAETPAVFMAFDLLERGGQDQRALPLFERRARLERLAEKLADAPALRLSPALPAGSWEAVAELHGHVRSRAAAGLVLKRLDSPYREGRGEEGAGDWGDWWKWKAAPLAASAVLLYAQQGEEGLYTDYTLGVWDESGLLVPVAKVGGGLGSEDAREVDAFIRRNTVERHGPVQVVGQELVFELAFAGVQASARRKAGLFLCAPRLVRWQRERLPGQADTLAALRGLLQRAGG